MKSICLQITKAEQAGILCDREIFLDTLETVAHSFQAKSAR